MYRFRTLLALLCVSSVTAVARADSFKYSYADGLGDSFTYTSAALLTTDAKIAPSSCYLTFALGHACSFVSIDEGAGLLDLNAVLGISVMLSDLPTSYFTPGTHQDDGSTLTITDIPTETSLASKPMAMVAGPVATTAEPSSLSLLALGAIGAALFFKPKSAEPGA